VLLFILYIVIVLDFYFYFICSYINFYFLYFVGFLVGRLLLYFPFCCAAVWMLALCDSVTELLNIK
jgi:hypothetical protein